MQAIVSIQVGGTGLRVGEHFWQHLRAEHGLNGDGQVSVPGATRDVGRRVFFRESRGTAASTGTWAPRAVLVDSGDGRLGVGAAHGGGHESSSDVESVRRGRCEPRGR